MFFKRRYNSNNAKLAILNRIVEIEKRFNSPGVMKQLDSIHAVVDNKYFFLNEKQSQMINLCLDAIEKHSAKQYETYAIKKCEHIKNILRGEYAEDAHSMAELKNEDKLYEMQSSLREIEDKVAEISKRMDLALGKDKNLWNMLNSERTKLKNRALVINKNYQTLLENQQTLAVAKDVKEAKLVSEEIMRQNTLDTVVEFEDNVEYTTIASEGTHENRERVQSVFSKAFSQGIVDDYEYERALESKLAETKLAGTGAQETLRKASGGF